MSTSSPLEWALSVWSGDYSLLCKPQTASHRRAPLDWTARFLPRCFLVYLSCADSFSSAKDQLSGTSVAIKKIMKPFSTPVLSKRTYRELKLLKHLRHENVRAIWSPHCPSRLEGSD
jgi:serine/threonine protein kinase